MNKFTLREKFPNTEFFLVQIQENTSIWTLFTKFLSTLTHFFPIFPFNPPKNIIKPQVFWYFQGGQKGTLGRNWLAFHLLSFILYSRDLVSINVPIFHSCPTYCTYPPFCINIKETRSSLSSKIFIFNTCWLKQKQSYIKCVDIWRKPLLFVYYCSTITTVR